MANYADYLLMWLTRQGVTRIFGNPGTTELPLIEALARQSHIEYVLGLHETAVCAMADGLARLTRHIQVVSLHAAPGLANAEAMIYNAAFSHSPLLLLIGQQDTRLSYERPFLGADLKDMIKPLVLDVWDITDPDHLLRSLRQAWARLQVEPSGPVALILPMNILSQSVENNEDPLWQAPVVPVRTTNQPSQEIIEEFVSLLARPIPKALVIGDRAVTNPEVLPALFRVAHYGHCDVFSEPFATQLTFLPWNDGCYYGRLPRREKDLARCLAPYRHVIGLGTEMFRVFTRDEDHLPWWDQAQVTQVDSDVRYFHYAPGTTSILSSLDAFIIGVANDLPDGIPCEPPAVSGIQDLTRPRAEEWETRDGTEQFWSSLASWISPDMIVVDESISGQNALLRHLQRQEPKTYYAQAGGSLGWGIGAAVGMCFDQGKPVIAIVGDGSALFGLYALWTAAQYQLPVRVLIYDNHGYQILKDQLPDNPRAHSMLDIRGPTIRWQPLLAGLSCSVFESELPKEPWEFEKVWQQFISQRGPSVWVVHEKI
ncbi:thiamine pyrophosphate-binding protein [Sulfobacillus thermosulfidooxidans]|uniref:thiamine pyrophosphate-binding protein n=1 Tax=Sulfobacillus thermosulfidooxidans TaxID=28034 RepID=UPI0003FDF97B|nr:thiamine pyrophosphate-binding protein [Sulfobacillus thermosulfidooxidans]